MLLVAGGQLDFNIGALLRRVAQRRVAHAAALVGPDLTPRLTIDLAADRLMLDGKAIRPGAVFMRHDVFLAQALPSPLANSVALNWYAAIKGWELAHDEVRGFNKRSLASEGNKLRNLYLARHHGLAVPETLLTNDFAGARRALRGPLIEKPAAGGEHTRALDVMLAGETPAAAYPRFVQRRLRRPELRVFRVGDALLGFALTSPDLDYREGNRVRLTPARVPAALGNKLVALCDTLGLDFAAADFMRAPRGAGHCFLEVNSQPMFAAFDQASGGRLCDAIIDALTRPLPAHR